MRLLALVALCCVVSFVFGNENEQIPEKLKDCGKPIDNSVRGSHPWLVVLKDTSVNPSFFYCTGSVISSQHVITGEHQIQPELIRLISNFKPFSFHQLGTALNL